MRMANVIKFCLSSFFEYVIDARGQVVDSNFMHWKRPIVWSIRPWTERIISDMASWVMITTIVDHPDIEIFIGQFESYGINLNVLFRFKTSFNQLRKILRTKSMFRTGKHERHRWNWKTVHNKANFLPFSWWRLWPARDSMQFQYVTIFGRYIMHLGIISIFSNQLRLLKFANITGKLNTRWHFIQ